MANLITDIQDAVKTRLLAVAELEGIEVVTEIQGDVIGKMDEILGKLGLGIFVSTPVCQAQQKDIPGPYFMRIQISVLVFENVELNRASEGFQSTAVDVGLCVANALHLFIPTGLGQISIATDRPSMQTIVDPELDILTYEVNFDTHGGLEQ
jgi:hypothetical protein